MAKKSIKSKGYRKSTSVTKEPWLSKRDIIILAVLVVLIAGSITLFNLLYDDGSLKLSDGKVVTEAENTLIAADTTEKQPRYFAVGQLADIEGYALTAEPLASDANLVEYIYTPEGESVVDEVRVSAYSSDAALMALGAQATFETTALECSPLTATDSGVEYFIHTDDDIDTVIVKTLNAYVPAGERCIVLRLIDRPGEDGTTNPDEALAAALPQFLEALTVKAE